MFERIKRAFNREGSEEGVKGASAYEYQSVVAVQLMMSGIFFNHKKSRVRLVWPFICFGTAVTGCFLMSLHAYHSLMVSDVPGMSESLVFLLITTEVVVQVPCFVAKADKIHAVIEMVERDFREMDEEPPEHHRKIFYKNQLLIWKLNLVWVAVFSVNCVAFGSMTFFEILYRELIQEYDENSVRPEMFKTWLPYDDSNKTPIYEIFLFLSYVALLMTGSTFGSYVSYMLQFIMHAVGQFELIVADFDLIFDFSWYREQGFILTVFNRRAIIRRRMAEIAKRHQRVLIFCDLTFDVIGPLLFYQILLSSAAICLTGFQVANAIENGGFDILFTLLFIAALVQLFVPCCLGTFLSNGAYDASIACYSCGWESTPDSQCIAKDLQIFLQHTSRPYHLHAMNLANVSVETFSSIVSSAVSYFTMLRQFNEETG